MNKNILLLILLLNLLGASNMADFSFEQSSAQAFYFFNQVLIDGEEIESDDWVIAYKNDICVGSRQWNLSQCGGGVCDVPVMGDDGTEGTSGYMLSGEIPTFKVFDSSEGELVEMNFYNNYSNDIVSWEWSNLNIVIFSKLINKSYTFNNMSDFEHTASISAIFTNDDYFMSTQDILVGYDDGQIVSISNAAVNSIAGGYIFFSSIFLNEPIDDLIFEYYNSNNNLIFNIIQSFDININDNFGNALSPVILTIQEDDLNISDHINFVDSYLIIDTYPNPFNPVLNIELNLLKSDYLTMSVFDINGKEIVKIIDDYKISGKHYYTWDASNVSSGIYFIIIKKIDGTDLLMKRICLIK